MHTPLIATIVAGLVGAFVFGALAQRFKVSPLIGYLLAGVIIGPFTPGYVADQHIANELAEIGVILLMFGVGLHFSLKDLLSVRKVAVPGAIVQMIAATLLGMGMAAVMGWSPVNGFVFGLALSVASTVVLLRALQERRIMQTDRGRIAVGWLIVEDLAMVLALVLLPALAKAVTGDSASAGVAEAWLLPIALTVVKVGAFIAFMLIVGRRVIPWILHWVAHTGSRELFRLAVLAIALGVAFGAALLFDVSFALGAFFAGMILAESELSHRAAEETLPLRDAFAVLFFVSVGMLFNPLVIATHPMAVLATLGIIVAGKAVAALIIMRAFRRDTETSLTVAASLAQIGEFSFILAGLGVTLGLLPPLGRDLILAGAILSIMLNPLVFWAFGWLLRRLDARRAQPPAANDSVVVPARDHTILVGFGRVGEVVAAGLAQADVPFVIVDIDHEACERARAGGFQVIESNPAAANILSVARIETARRLMVAIPDPTEAGAIVDRVRRGNPQIEIVARAHSDAEVQHLKARGADAIIMGEREIALGMLDFAGLAAAGAKPVPAPASPAGVQPASGEKLIFDDAEAALLGAFHALDLNPGAATSKETVRDRALASLISETRLDEAFATLRDKGCLKSVGDQRVSLTPTGFLWAASTLPHWSSD